ncbi:MULTISPECIES: hypothetical protein [unclassified Bradyrhizobium]|uniref:hypothetical protein n=1 Tax=unclassified Bradyrhizobium TaxID=2631580 RepID=UPI001CD5C304|nr:MULTISPECIES: hypothetical protein [unclassified Bradyrhizobium]MCA1386058.1 hypothetical protein [Bradyrhizobium sp. BRP05]MCA1393856.1 hypothetical protein [Bradyrhizobium sp. IC3123]MCA1423500.1 hypothetical protein [Bradyrhizobium sp. BRP23]MCA1430606.1 hypothetical protein [Bradyrhizobium sp. NBAIM16]MCA1480117.1 hypothetical protein [Bradyrhizobium sp. NBAIM08]
MAQRAVSREDVQSLFAFYAFVARHHNKHDGASRWLKLFTSSQNLSDERLNQWSERVDAVGPEMVGRVLDPRARAVVDGDANYDHASAFLHARLKALDEPQH